MEIAEIFHTSAIRSPSLFALRRICKGILTYLLKPFVHSFCFFVPLSSFSLSDFGGIYIFHEAMKVRLILSSYYLIGCPK
jgi:hypothetical protein